MPQAQVLQVAASSHANTNGNNISDTTNNNTNSNASSSTELVFLNEENTMEVKDLNAILDWFFQPTGTGEMVGALDANAFERPNEAIIRMENKLRNFILYWYYLKIDVLRRCFVD